MTESKKPTSPVVHPPRTTRISWIWFIPLLAALVGVSLLVRNWVNTGPTITIAFESADGLEVGQTKVRYKDVVVGVVKSIVVAPDRNNVLVSVEIRPTEAEFITQEGSRFWVVRPRLGLSGVSGLGTLLSGAYISVDASVTRSGAAVYDFTGLEKPPEVVSGRPGKRFSLSAPDLGSLEIGSPVYFRRIPVGRVIGYDLDTIGKAVDIQVFVDAPADQFVGADTRFWNASGIDFSFDGGGINVRTNSLAAVVAGGLAFANPDEREFKSMNPGQVFQLHSSEPLAMADPDGMPFPIELHFQQSVRGLTEGAVIDFRGLELGKVVDIDLEYNSETKRFFALVKAQLYPLRFGAIYENLIDLNTNIDYPGQALLAPLVEHGLRAQLRASNLLTGQQYVALDFFPDASAVSFNPHQIPLVLPTIAGSFDRLQQQVSSIVTKLDNIPYDTLVQEVRGSVVGLSRLLASIETQVVPSTNQALKAAQGALSNAEAMLAQDAPMTDRLDSTLREITNAARSLRSLADYLQTNPSSLIRGPASNSLSISP
ncbi:MCE family protein [Alcaligenaceae bacterium]|nr:MCE family protein [Alcaligenaceae bacterium]